MKFAAVFSLAAGAAAWSNGTNVAYTTEVVTALTTYCPMATQITMGNTTYTVTKATTLTITDCPCTIRKPVTTMSSVVCKTCGPSYTSSPSYTKSYTNSTGAVAVPSVPTSTPTKSVPAAPTAGAGRTAALSGAGLAGVLGLAAFVL